MEKRPARKENALESKNPKEKYGRLKQLLIESKENPQRFYPDFDEWSGRLSDKNNFIKWAAIDIIGHLSAIDKDKKVDKQLNKLIKILHEGKMISSNHAVYSLCLIAINKPGLRNKIIKELLAVSCDKFETSECANIVTGKIVLALGDLAKYTILNKDALEFIKKARSNSRNATRKKAENLLKKIQKIQPVIQP
ncbi:MAG: hypothetical protein ACXVO9_06950 [Bacteroidia bacterium]